MARKRKADSSQSITQDLVDRRLVEVMEDWPLSFITADHARVLLAATYLDLQGVSVHRAGVGLRHLGYEQRVGETRRYARLWARPMVWRYTGLGGTCALRRYEEELREVFDLREVYEQ